MGAKPLSEVPTNDVVARAKHLPLRLPSAPPELVPARMINECLYCERLLYLEWAQGEFEDNHFTVEGRTVHKRADVPGGALPPKPRPVGENAEPTTQEGASGGTGDEEEGTRGDGERPYQARSVWLSSERLGITAKIDVVDGDGTGRVVPIEYKRGKPPEVPEGAYLPERAQLCAQVLLLREHGYSCDQAAIYFAGARRRVEIAIDEALIAATLGAAARAREVVEKGQIPPPLDHSPKCIGCSLSGICLPDEVRLLQELGREAGEPLSDETEGREPGGAEGNAEDGEKGSAAAPEKPRETRRLQPGRDDKLPLYVQEQGARVGVTGERLVVTGRDGTTSEARLPQTSQVSLFGNVQVSTQALRTLCERHIPLFLFTTGGFFVGRLISHDSNNVEQRMAQHKAAADPERCLALAIRFVTAKVRNCRTMLRRNAETPDAARLSELEQLAKKAEKAESIASLLGLEGAAARAYFGSFSSMLRGGAREMGFDFEGRNRRPPRDPVNALLSFLYALLTKEWTRALMSAGLDPLVGFYHQPRFGRPALALDLMEEFRPLLADSAVLSILNTGVVGPEDFLGGGGTGTALSPAARRRVIGAYERRMDQEVTHPLFGYRVSYRRILEVQARLFGRHLMGEIEAYPEFRTR